MLTPINTACYIHARAYFYVIISMMSKIKTVFQVLTSDAEKEKKDRGGKKERALMSMK